MLPIVLTKELNVLIVGAGRACEIKLKVLSKHPCKITIVARAFLCNIDKSVVKIKKDFDELEEEFFSPFDLIYIATKVESTKKIEKLLQKKALNYLSNPELSNFIHPCSREDGEIIVSVNSIHKPNPKRACELANRFLEYKKCHDL